MSFRTFTLIMFTAGVMLLFAVGCDKVEDNGSPLSSGGEDWLIPINEIFDGGPGKDGIPALSSPNMTTIDNIDYMSDGERIIIFKSGENVRGYPHIVLDWHELINDFVNGVGVSITYCPLTGSAIGWDRKIDGTNTSFGVSGLLYNTNLIPYDRNTNSNWSQMGLECVNGSLKGQKVNILPVVETNWKTFKEMYPNGLVVTTNTGYNRSYGRYPYGDYKSNDGYLLFPINNDDGRLPRKDRVFGVIIGEQSRAYPMNSFSSTIQIIEDNIDSKPIAIVGSSLKDFAVAFNRTASDGTILAFTAIDNELPVIMSDNEGNRWDIFGNAVSGPRIGQQLAVPDSFIAFWFAWGAFYPSIQIHGIDYSS